MTAPTVWVAGRPLDAVAPWDGLTWTNALSGGCVDASWRIEVPRGWDHRVLARRALVEVRVGGTPVFAGELTEPDRDSWEMHATGLAAAGDRFWALAADASSGKWVGTSTQLAIARGLPWATHVFRGAPFPDYANPPLSEEEDNGGLNRINTLWDAAAEASGRYWGVGPDRVPYALPRATTPKWQASVPPDALGEAGDEFATHILGVYRTTTGTYARLSVGNADAAALWGRSEEAADLTAHGPMTAARATSILTDMLAKLLPRPGYTNGLEFAEWDLTTVGGVKADPLLVEPGDVIRLHGVRDNGVTPRGYHDIVADKIRYDAPRRGGVTVQVEPLGLAARNLRSVLEGTDTRPRLAS